ncbi:sugar ABC transporter ATP-binding protein [Paenibacillus sp. Soil766]|uniref:carbohydrate ABC transporter permease n=1 Tax=Paenibacillus sp. Soil766 TaxID=1736404 RepID=UPI00070C4014|nr:carbohydrate ABC transporter permease [Paenibacillus sp. Soil766]KRF09629.1 sugar ABC transporter ATP-binding protein [Paenibacillus sp. Soil766]
MRGFLHKQTSSSKEVVSKLMLTVVLGALSLTMVLPFIWMLSTSLKGQAEVFVFPVKWIPSVFRWDNYKSVWMGSNPFWLYYLNSIKVTILTVAGTVVISSAAAYGFSRIVFKGRDTIFMLYLATLMIPDQVTLIPRFILFKYLGMYNSHLALIVPGVFVVFAVFLLRQFYITIPHEFSEAARIEGAGHFLIWTKIVMPLSKPALVSLVILNVTSNWNEFINPLVFLSDNKLYTVPLGLTNYIDEMGTDYTLMMAASVSAVLPIILIFILAQRWFVEGVVSSGIKG